MHFVLFRIDYCTLAAHDLPRASFQFQKYVGNLISLFNMPVDMQQRYQAATHLAVALFNIISSTHPITTSFSLMQALCAFGKLNSIPYKKLTLKKPTKIDTDSTEIVTDIATQSLTQTSTATPVSTNINTPSSPAPTTPLAVRKIENGINTTHTTSVLTQDYAAILKTRLDDLNMIDEQLKQCYIIAQMDKWEPATLSDKNCKIVHLVEIIPILRSAVHKWQGMFSDCVC